MAIRYTDILTDSYIKVACRSKVRLFLDGAVKIVRTAGRKRCCSDARNGVGVPYTRIC